MKPKPKKKPGPEAERVKISAPWEEAVKLALSKKKPTDGWPVAPPQRQGKT